MRFSFHDIISFYKNGEKGVNYPLFFYAFSKRYEKLSVQEQLIYLKEAEEIFNAFDKVPNALWEDEYEKYNEVLEKYKDIKMLRWANN